LDTNKKIGEIAAGLADNTIIYVGRINILSLTEDEFSAISEALTDAIADNRVYINLEQYKAINTRILQKVASESEPNLPEGDN